MRHNLRHSFMYGSVGILFIIVLYFQMSRKKVQDPRSSLAVLQQRMSHIEVSIEQVRTKLLTVSGNFVRSELGKIVPYISNSSSSYPITQGVIDPTKFTYRINVLKSLCRASQFSLFVYVHSQAVNFERRNILRKTWANRDLLAKLKVGFVFITGVVLNDSSVMRRIEKESRDFGDMVQTDYVDTYKNISIKSTASLNWVATYCAPYVPVILKSDDDIFVNITRLVDYVRIDLPIVVSSRGERLLFCNLWESEEVIRDQFDRWFIPKELFDSKAYPPFCQGSALILTSQSVLSIRNALIGARFFPLDDVLLTGFMAPIAGVSLIPINTRHLRSLKARNITNEDLKSDFLFVHTNMPNLLKLWKYTKLSL